MGRFQAHKDAPDEVWLQIGYGDEGEHTWAPHQVAEDDIQQAGPYVRADRLSGRVTVAAPMTDRKTIIARAICAERCAEYGEPPCWKVVDDGSLSPDCGSEDDCSCEQLAVAVEADLTGEDSNDAA